MAQISLVKKSELEGAIRLDAEYYQPKYRNAVDVVQKYGSFCELGKIGKVLRGKNPKAYKDSGIPVIRAIDLRDLTKTGDFLYAAPEEELFLLRQGDILISSIGEGSIGKVQVFQDIMKCATVSEVSVIRTTGYNPHALAAFLKTSYGYLQLERRITGSTGQLHLYPKDITTVVVPLIPDSAQKSVEEIDIESDREFRRSKALYLQAEQLLLDELGFKDLDLSHQLYYMVPYKKTKRVSRLDAEYFQPKYERLIQYIQRLPYLRLEDVTQTIRNGKTPAAEDYSIEGVPILKVGGLRNTGVIEECYAYVPASWAQANTKGAVKQLDALVLCAAHLPSYIGKTGLLMEDLGPLTRAVGELIILRFNKKISPEFVCVYLNLDPVRLAVQRLTRGNTAHLYPDDLSALPVPLLPPELQRRIADLVTKSWEARQKARRLLEEAKHKVEAIIEGKPS
jgi:type I restriction enzyme S subunit